MGSGEVMIRRNRLAFLLVCLLLLGALSAYAQEKTRSKFEIFSVRNLYISKSSFDDGSESPDGQKRMLSINMFDATLNIPTRFQDGKTVIIHSLGYQLLEFNRWETAAGGLNPAYEVVNRLDDFTAVEYRLLALHSFSGGRWRWWLVSYHGLYSDFTGGLSSGDYRLQAALAIERTWESGAVFGLGLAYSSTISFPVLPVLTLHTSPESAFKLDLTLPLNGTLTYRVSEKAEVGIAGAVEGNRYNLQEIKSQNSPAVTNNLRYSAGTIGPRAKLRVAGPCYLVVDAGRTFRRRLEFFNGNSKTGEIDLENNWFARIAFNVEL
jgi:hypothetical protein